MAAALVVLVALLASVCNGKLHQSMCAPTVNATVTATWCSKQNPFLTVLPLPHGAVNGTQTDAQCGDTDDPQALCKVVTAVTAIEVGPWSFPAGIGAQHTRQVGQVAGRMDGKLAVTWTATTTALQAESYTVSLPGSGEVAMLRSLSPANATFLFAQRSGPGSPPQLLAMTALGEGEAAMSCAIAALPAQATIEQASIYHGVNESAHASLVLLLRDGASGNHSLRFAQYAVSDGACLAGARWTWQLQLPHAIAARQLDMYITSHFYAYRQGSLLYWPQQPTTDASAQSLIAIAWPGGVSLFGLRACCDGLVLPVGQPGAPSTFYLAGASRRVGQTTVYGDVLRRLSLLAGKAACLRQSRDSQLIWLAATTRGAPPPAPQEHKLLTLSLDEFARLRQATQEARPAREIVLDAADRAANLSRCEQLQFWDVQAGSCVARALNSVALPAAAESLQAAPRGLPPVADAPEQLAQLLQLISAPVETALQSVCDRVRQLTGSSAAYDACQRDIIDEARNSTVCDVYGALLNSSAAGKLLNSFLYQTLALRLQPPTADSYTQQLLLLGAQPVLNTARQQLLQQLSSLSFPGRLLDSFLTDNSMHIFIAAARRRWQVASLTRFHDICRRLAAQPDDPFLAPYAAQCAANPDARVTIGSFGFYVSSCPPGTSCPSFVRMAITPPQQVLPGRYSLYSWLLQTCSAGSFCISGRQVRCPPGSACPRAGLSRPQLCHTTPQYNTTCFDSTLRSGVVTRQPCPLGTVCTVPYLPGTPAPPGYFLPQPASRASFAACQRGQWCGLGRHNASALACPGNTFCSSPTVLQPTVCNFTASFANYCPAGSWREQACPAGSSCSSPTSKAPCDEHYFCPNGTVVEAVCPAGHYCPTPADSRECPQGFYCRPGSRSPIACPLLTACPAGTTQPDASALGPVALLALAFVIWLLYRLYVVRRNHQRRKATTAMARATAGKRAAISGGGAGVSSGGGSSLQAPLLAGAAPRESTVDSILAAGIAGLTKKSYTIDFAFRDLGLQLRTKAKTKVLDGVTGSICSGRLTAIMGPSGSGKTSFLTTLAGRAHYGTQLGSILLNGKPGDTSRMKNLVGFVPQEDIMMRDMTVLENLMFSAKTRLPANMSRVAVRRVVAGVTRALGLEDVLHSLIGDEEKRGISGGQRKRVNIGIELVADPTVLFLDEPTSGLDSSSSQEVIAALRDVSRMGLTIAAVIHQPRYEIFELIDDVLLLGKGGRTVYLGPTEGALPYFTSLGFHLPPRVNPADFFLDVISGLVPREGDPDFQASHLFGLWEQHQREMKKTMDAMASEGGKEEEEEEEEDKEEEKGGDVAVGSGDARGASFSNLEIHQPGPAVHNWSTFWKSFFMGMLTGPFGLLAVDVYQPFDSDAQFGVVYGVHAFTILLSALCVLLTAPYWATSLALKWMGILWAAVGSFVLLVMVAVLPRRAARGKTVVSALNFLLGVLIVEPLGLLWVWLKPHTSRKARAAALFGLAAQSLLLGSFFISVFWERQQAQPDCALCPTMIAIGMTTLWLGFIIAVVFYHRFHRLPTDDRVTAGLSRLLYYCVKRSLVQQTRNWGGVLFDHGLVLLAGSFLGLIYMHSEYIGPLPSSVINLCPKSLRVLCGLPRYDPVLGQASLSVLALSLASVASSLRVFGREKVVFSRESSTGLSTEAYFFGKLLSHLPTILSAPFVFLLMYYQLASPLAPFWQYYVLFVVVYALAATVAYSISLVFPSSVQQLLGVLAVLVCMMFSGANPTLKQLANPKLLGGLLKYPAYVSYVRWAQEAYYLQEITHYQALYDVQSGMSIFDYSFSQLPLCWTMMLRTLFGTLTLSYVALVKREP